MFAGLFGLYFPTKPQQDFFFFKKEIWFPDIWQTAHTKLRKIQYHIYSMADPAETSPLLWRAADSVTTRKQVRQNSFVLQAYFDIGLFGGLWMSGSRLWKHKVAPQFFLLVLSRSTEQVHLTRRVKESCVAFPLQGSGCAACLVGTNILYVHIRKEWEHCWHSILRSNFSNWETQVPLTLISIMCPNYTD